jgi:hypothetical protein
VHRREHEHPGGREVNLARRTSARCAQSDGGDAVARIGSACDRWAGVQHQSSERRYQPAEERSRARAERSGPDLNLSTGLLCLSLSSSLSTRFTISSSILQRVAALFVLCHSRHVTECTPKE